MKKAALLFTVILAAACITTNFKRGLVARRAAFDFGCQDVAVEDLGNDTFGASGCGKKSAYIVVCTGGAARTDKCNAIMNGPN